MPASLRKSCHACVLAKRRCNPQLPQCSRCLKNRLACTYVLEPLTQASSSTKEPVEGANSHDEDHQPPAEADRQPSFSIFGDVAAAQQAAMKSMQLESQGLPAPELRMVADPELIEWFSTQFRQIPDSVVHNRSSPLVHAQLYQKGADSRLRMERILRLQNTVAEGHFEEVISPSQNVHLRHLTNIKIQSLPTSDVLTSIQELGLYLMVYLGNNLPAHYESEAQGYIDLPMGWVEHLWSVTQEQSSQGSSQWYSWLVAESARRSIIACHLIKAAISILRSGYCVYVPFLEALPFDARIGLWEATSEDAWHSIVMKHGGQPEVLMSFREFIESSEDLSRIKDEGVFPRILLLAFYGKRALQAL